MAGNLGAHADAEGWTTSEIWRRRLRRAQSWLLCHLGRHLYARHRNPEVGGPDAEYWQCRRCGRERNEYARPGTRGPRGLSGAASE